MEPSSSQVTYPVHMRALSSWAENTSALSSILVRAAHRHTRLLSRLGYAQLDFPPVYGVPEEEVTNNTELLRSDSAFVKLYL
ncbi:hypothetical protein EG68_09318 [Paragonimus skrjabini miyazakii]|uniref:Uncharacterized protein n=1 Tax=Paragonimus skrjabini miyazakii TaxID=59628 RepID=A0A8S9YGE4_9TREM|nr:hypothetical protein EG68_09318 [Paragonimus skrjabini miyazakii]